MERILLLLWMGLSVKYGLKDYQLQELKHRQQLLLIKTESKSKGKLRLIYV